MSTRCQVWVRGHGASIYRHSDGYPDGDHGVLHSLLPVVQAFANHGRWDPAYMTAQISAKFVARSKESRERTAKLVPSTASYLQGEGSILGHGIDGVESNNPEFHGDEEFIYVVDPTGVEARTPLPAFYDEPTLGNTQLERVITIKPQK